MKTISVNDVIKATGGKCVNPGQDADIKNINAVTMDSRTVRPGTLFVAIKGERTDGHNYMASAFEKGAAAVICDHVPEGVSGTCIVVKDTVEALQKLAGWYRSTLNVRVVGITGSVGKTSTKEIVASVLGAHYRVHKTEGNHNNELGLPLTVLSIDEDSEIAVLEMGISNFGEMRVLSSIAKPDICVITNIGQAHLEFLGSRDGILKAKSEIFEFMNPEGRIYLNGDDDKLMTVKAVNGITPTFFGFGRENDVYAENVVSLGLKGSSMHIVLRDSGFDAVINIPGRHMVMNAVCAAAIAHDLGLSNGEIIKGLSDAKTISGRSNLIACNGGFIIDDCYNASPNSMHSAVDTLGLAIGRKVAILGDMLEIGEDSDKMHAEVGSYAVKNGVDELICVGKNSKFMHEGAVAEKTGAKVLYFETLEGLMDVLDGELKPGDNILIKASNGMKFSSIVAKLTE